MEDGFEISVVIHPFRKAVSNDGNVIPLLECQLILAGRGQGEQGKEKETQEKNCCTSHGAISNEIRGVGRQDRLNGTNAFPTDRTDRKVSLFNVRRFRHGYNGTGA